MALTVQSESFLVEHQLLIAHRAGVGQCNSSCEGIFHRERRSWCSEVLRKRLGSGQDQAVETAKDLKYVRERQQIHALGVSKSFFQFECFLFLYRVSS